MIRKIHHIGIVVRSLDEADGFYRDLLGLPVTKETTIPEQGVRAALLRLGESEMELLEPLVAEGGVARFLERRGEGMHHLCFETDDIVAEMEGMKGRGLELIDREPRDGLAGRVCFLHPRASRGVLVELAQPVEATSPRAEDHAPLELDHVVVAVEDLPGAIALWCHNLQLAEPEVVHFQGHPLRLARFPLGTSFLELVAPELGSTRFAAALRERGEGLFSLAVRVQDLDATVAELRARGVKPSAPEAGVWPGTRIARLAARETHGVSLQLIERR